MRRGDVYTPDPKYVRDVIMKHAMKKVDEYLKKEKAAKVDDIVEGIKGEEGTNIKPEWVEEALRYLAGAGRVRYNKLTGEWETTLRGI